MRQTKNIPLDLPPTIPLKILSHTSFSLHFYCDNHTGRPLYKRKQNQSAESKVTYLEPLLPSPSGHPVIHTPYPVLFPVWFCHSHMHINLIELRHIFPEGGEAPPRVSSSHGTVNNDNLK